MISNVSQIHTCISWTSDFEILTQSHPQHTEEEVKFTADQEATLGPDSLIWKPDLFFLDADLGQFTSSLQAGIASRVKQ